ncbi:PaaI family thioesterase [Rugosimonospora africana]|uniref:Phenylacetic acid degradation protein n=1 Tax=Rugosimonospora africana TaxID=556532 RepID=A0A8J3VNU5_9ACTN|nr:PaaI family thioesterase [Rugosimonospora africana]GIH13539.1 phenylacetic acid degradation protein [Rugosimonospora africana]
MTQTQEVGLTRTRTFSWSDPAAHAAMVGRRSGLEMLRAMISGELPPPPFMQTIDVDGFEADEGRVTVRLTPQEFHYNPLGSVHGGILSTLLDTAAACTVHSVLPAGQGYTSMDLNVKFLRPVTTASGQLRCTGAILSRTRRNALAEARLTDESGQLVAYATSSCLIFDVPPGR